MTTKTKFRNSMISDAQKAATAMQKSPIASKLKANGYTPAVMTKHANELTALHAAAETAHDAWLAAGEALSEKAEEFDLSWSAYCNLVRGLTTSVPTRKAHGVPSPGLHKGPSYKRGPNKKGSSGATPPATPSPAK